MDRMPRKGGLFAMYTFLAFGAGLAFLLSAESFLSNRRNPGEISNSPVVPPETKGSGFLDRNLVPFLFFGIGLIQFHLYLELSGQLQDVLWFSLAHVPILFWIGPLTYLYFQRLIGIQTGRLALFHFLPGGIAFAFLLPYYLSNSESKVLFLAHGGTSQDFFYKILIGLLVSGTILNFIYPMALVRNIWAWRKQSNQERRFVFTPFLVLFLGTIFLLLLFVIAQVFYMPLFPIAACGLTVLLSAVFLTGATRVALIQNFRNEIRSVRYAESRIRGLDLDLIVSRMDDLMREKRLFLDEELSLAGLASELKIQTHQLSEILNSRLGKNFRDYLTDFRLSEAARLLEEEPQRSVISVLYSSGFKSKSAFHKLFQERYGLTPTVYRFQKSANSGYAAKSD